MQQSVAEQLVKAIMSYRSHPNTHDVEAWAKLDAKGNWVVDTSLGYRYPEVPTRLELNDHACLCSARWCASGKVAPGLLEKIRAGEPAPA